MSLVQAAIDVMDIETGKKTAKLAYEKGADIIEVGTGLLFKYGFDAIREIRKAVGSGARIIADYKYAAGWGLVGLVKDAGCDMVLLTAGYKDFLITETVKACRNAGIVPVFDLFINFKDVGSRVPQLVDMGVEYLFIHRFEDVWMPGEETRRLDALRAIKDLNLPVKVDLTSDKWQEAADAARDGADIVTFGRVLLEPDADTCEKWIRMIHGDESV